MANVITSPSNDKVKLAVSLQERRGRVKEGKFLIEGVRLLEEAFRARVMPQVVFYDETAWNANERLKEIVVRLDSGHVPVFATTPAIIAKLTNTTTPQGVAAVVPIVTRPAVSQAPLVLIIDGVRDPGNLGTILRTAEAAGVGQVLLAPGTVDAYSPKVVRAGMGAHFRLSIVESENWDTLRSAVVGRTVWLAAMQAPIAYTDVDWKQASALLIGGEASGTSQEGLALANGVIYIPMQGPTESLNAAVAAAVILFEAARQHASM